VPFKSAMKSTALAMTADFTPLQSTLTKDCRKSQDDQGASNVKGFEIDEKKISPNIEEDKKHGEPREDTDKDADIESTGGEVAGYNAQSQNHGPGINGYNTTSRDRLYSLQSDFSNIQQQPSAP